MMMLNHLKQKEKDHSVTSLGTGPRFFKPSSLYDDCQFRTLRLALCPTNFSHGNGMKMIYGEEGGGGVSG